MHADFEFQLDMRIESANWPETLEPLAHRAIGLAIARADVQITPPAEISLLLTGDAEQRAINAQWRQIDKSTNVLSFPQFEPFEPMFGLLGDLSLARETLEREANDLGIEFEHHFAHLLVHGTLHLLGYDHETDEDAAIMEQLETRILAEMHIADPYAEA